MDIKRFTLDTYLQPGETFHFARKDVDTNAPRYLHRHDYFEVFLIERGAARHWINERVERLEQGSFVFIRPHDAHALQAIDRQSCRIINVIFAVETADHLKARYGGTFENRFFWKTGPEPDSYRLQGPRMERAVNTALELQTSERSLVLIEGYLLYIMTRVIDHRATASDQAPAWLAAACQAARQSDVFRKGAAGLVEVSGRGHEHVARKTKQHFGLSPTAYVNRIRMEHAAMVLGGSDMTIADVAADCGLDNLSHFYRLFRDHYGTTPHAYRNRYQKNPIQPAD